MDCNQASCRLETKYNGQWGTVCGAGFTEESARVVCRSLGFRGGTARNHGGGTGPIWLSAVRCEGKEDDVGDCPKSCGAVGGCTHGWDVGVCCVGNLIQHASAVTQRKTVPASFKTVGALRAACYAPPTCKAGGGTASFRQNCGPAGRSGGWEAKLGQGRFSRLGGGGTCDNDADLCVIKGCSLVGEQLSSLTVPSGLEVVLFDQPAFAGVSSSYVGPITIECLADEGWQGRARSAVVRAAKPGPPSAWTMRVFRSRRPLDSMPDVALLPLVGTAVVPLLAFHSQYDFERYVPATPGANYAAAFYGAVVVVGRGIYTFCTTSDDGSSLSVDGSLLVENGGLHGAVQRCAARELAAGKHEVHADMFQAGGGVFFTVTWSGPDTDGRPRLLRSAEEAAPRLPPPSTWGMVMYAAPYDLRSMPDVASLTEVGTAIVPTVDFHSLGEFREYVAATPGSNYAGIFYGKFEVRAAGDYVFCTVSDDGSSFWIDGDQVPPALPRPLSLPTLRWKAQARAAFGPTRRAVGWTSASCRGLPQRRSSTQGGFELCMPRRAGRRGHSDALPRAPRGGRWVAGGREGARARAQRARAPALVRGALRLCGERGGMAGGGGSRLAPGGGVSSVCARRALMVARGGAAGNTKARTH